MKVVPHRWSILVIVLLALPIALQAQPGSVKELDGVWESKRVFGPEIRGTLLLRQSGGGWIAEIAGRVVNVKLAGNELSFDLPDGKGSFTGKLVAGRSKVTGHWTQPATIASGARYASPVTMVREKGNTYRGDVAPLADEFTLYLVIKSNDDGTTSAFLRNPERNLGRFFRVAQIDRDGNFVRLRAANEGATKGRVLTEGKYEPDEKVLSIYLPGGATFDFKRVETNKASDFYPRGYPTVPYSYVPPPLLDDGWQTGSLEEVGISRTQIERFVQMIIDTPTETPSSLDFHGVLIARRGKLVLEEYFHGEHRDKPHDTRSAAKSMTATMVGAAINAGVPLEVSTPVYQLMNGGVVPNELDTQKRAITVEHLLTMSPGLDCNDGDPNSPGDEDVMQSQRAEPDFYKFMLALRSVRSPGQASYYCSGVSNLLGGVLQRSSKQTLPVLFQDLIAEPMQIRRYYMMLTPTGDAYMGGGFRFLPRDFMKLGLLHLNGGTWNSRRILSEEWSRRSTSHLVNVVNRRNGQYGYQWWVREYPYKGRNVRAFFAAGNGGQIVMGFPELDLVIAFFGGNYNDPALFIPQNVYVPEYILPAIENLSRAKTAP